MKYLSERQLVRLAFVETVEREGWRNFRCKSEADQASKQSGTLSRLNARARVCAQQFEKEHGFSIERFHAGLTGARTMIITTLAIIFFLAGLLSNYLAPQGRVNLLFNPVIGYLLWSMIVYLFMLVSTTVLPALGASLQGFSLLQLTGNAFQSAVFKLRSMLPESGEDESGISKLALKASRQTLSVLSSYYLRQMRSITHIWALSLASGIITGLYTRGLGISYQFYWESTFIHSPEFVESLLSFLLAPALLLVQRPLPEIAPRLEPMPGAEWIHLLALAIVGWVIIPRIVLLVQSRLSMRSSLARAELRLDDDYYRSILFKLAGSQDDRAVIIYGFGSEGEVDSRVRPRIATAIGVERLAPAGIETVEWGETELPSIEPGSDLVTVFNGIQTPEEDVQGAFLDNCIQAGRGTMLVLVDLGGLESRRYESRRSAWDASLNKRQKKIVYRFLSDEMLAGETERTES